MAEPIRSLQKVQELQDLHWFCPRQGPSDTTYYYPEDLEIKVTAEQNINVEEISKKVEQARERQALVFDSFTILAYDVVQAAEPQKWLEDCLCEQMTQCDVCVREFHRGRRDLKQRLTDDYDDDTVKAFMDRFDEMNVRRIKRGLRHALEILRVAAPDQRTISCLDSVGLYAIFEALNCVPVVCDEDLLSESFDEVFRLVQTNRLLKMNNYTPAVSHFLFSTSSYHNGWAIKSWQKFRRNITSMEFEWTVREPLLQAMMRVQLFALEKDFLPKFWAGVEAIVRKLDQNLITHSLRAMDIDVCKLGLDHLQVDTDGLKNLLATIHHILKTSPADFWESMGSISFTVWVEQFYNSPALVRLLCTVRNQTALDELFLWIIPFLNSVGLAHRASACRALVNPLMGSLQDEKYAYTSRTYCYKLGLTLLADTLRVFNDDECKMVTRATTLDVLEEVERQTKQFQYLIKPTSALFEECTNIIHQALALDCKCFLIDQDALLVQKQLPHPSFSFFPNIWKQCARVIASSNMSFASAVLLTVTKLIGVEKHVGKKGQAFPEDFQRFNEALDVINGFVVDILDQINEFKAGDLSYLFEEPRSSIVIIMQAFSSDVQVRLGAIDVIKTAAGLDNEREAFKYLLDKFYVSTLDAISQSLRQVSYKKVFAPASSMLRLCADILEILCNSQEGLLRSRNLTPPDAKATENFWHALWQALATIFSTAEAWSNLGFDKKQMQNFCRDTMECAEKTFDQFAVFAGSLEASKEVSTISAGSRLAEHPRLAMNVIVRWLKLRDEFLVRQSAALVQNLLIRLREFDSKVGEKSLSIIVDVVLNKTHTKLTLQQKAELHRAVETHLGFPIVAVVDEEASDSEGLAQRSRSVAAASTSDSESMIQVVAANSSSVERRKAMMSALPSKLGKLTTSQAERSTDFKRTREQEIADKKKRDAESAALARRRINMTGITSHTVNASSSLLGLGVSGKNHSVPKGTGMMVSSEEESEQSADDLDNELFGTSKRNTEPSSNSHRANLSLPPRPRGPVRKQRVVRSSRDMRARLAPDLAHLHKNLLNWEFFHEGPYPPNTNAQDYATVPNSFRDPISYQGTFQPLLILEAWNSLLKAKEENAFRPYEVKILNRATVDAFLEVSSTVSHPEGRDVSEGDVILISKSKDPSNSPEEPHCLARVSRMTRRKNHIEVLYRVVPGTALMPFLVPNGRLYGTKIASIIPLEREYGALLGLKYYDLCDEIAKAKPSPLLTYSDERLEPFMRNYGVNKAQATAVKSAIDNDAFTLVQGPPGSGKTKTIVAIVGAVLTKALEGQGTTIIHPQVHLTHANGMSARPPAKKLLVCAPSNAAVDELVMRFKQGVKSLDGELRKVSVVRIGRSEAINASVADVTLEELVNKKLNLTTEKGNARETTHAVMKEHQEVSEKLRDARVKLDEAEERHEPVGELKETFDALRARKATLSQQVDNAKINETASSREAELNRRRAQQQIIDEAHVICATLSGSGHDMFQTLNVEFETVVIDEAAQCVELSALIPLKYGCAKCILVGDPQQLPPTVFSREAARFKYEQSLFVRMQANHPKDIHLLDTQYRMHPDISAFPSQAFYDGRLLDGENMATLRSRPWHRAALLGPFRFFDVQGQHQAAVRGHSLINLAEIRVAVQLYERLTIDFHEYDFSGKIGIITPYKSQLKQMKETFQRRFGLSIAEKIEFNTTDAFQGRESEIIIFSCVRASPAGGIGFLQDIRRMNVGLTRAKSSLWVLGNSQSLMKGEYWSKLVSDAKKRQSYTDGNLEEMLAKPSPVAGAALSGPPVVKAEFDNQQPPIQTTTRKHVITSSNVEKTRTHDFAIAIPAKRKLSSSGEDLDNNHKSSLLAAHPSSPASVTGFEMEMVDASTTASSKEPTVSSNDRVIFSANHKTTHNTTSDKNINGVVNKAEHLSIGASKAALVKKKKSEPSIFIKKKKPLGR